jgi:hypothetical protein
MWNRLFKIARILLGVLCIPAFYGITGNRADSIFLIIISFFQGSIVNTMPRWLLMLVILLLILVISLGLSIAFLYYRSQQVAISLVKLDDSLLRLLSSFKQNPNREYAENLLFQEFLTDTLELFTDGCRISIFRPDNHDSEFLTIWQSLRVPPETIQRTRFYIGSNKDDKRVGIAGLVFKQQMLKIAHLSWQKDKWSPDDTNYYNFVDRTTPKSMPYRVVVAVPIVDNTNPNQCLGVLCLDSMNEKAFDSKKIQDGLRSVADRISAILLILKNYS